MHSTGNDWRCGVPSHGPTWVGAPAHADKPLEILRKHGATSSVDCESKASATKTTQLKRTMGMIGACCDPVACMRHTHPCSTASLCAIPCCCLPTLATSAALVAGGCLTALCSKHSSWARLLMQSSRGPRLSPMALLLLLLLKALAMRQLLLLSPLLFPRQDLFEPQPEPVPGNKDEYANAASATSSATSHIRCNSSRPVPLLSWPSFPFEQACCSPA
eukprot:1161979-Pelagomonas_calceolata.AAC.6